MGKIIAQFIQAVYPDIEVRHISSESMGIFRYDDNVRFVKSEVRPATVPLLLTPTCLPCQVGDATSLPP